MDNATRARLHDLTLRARRLLTDEVRELFEGIYGIGSDGRFEPAEDLSAVRELERVRATRERLESFLADEAEAGLRGREAVDRLVGEVAFTYLNRLVAFKMLESRGLIRGTLDKHHASNAFLFYLNDHPEDYALYQAGDFPKDRLGEGPRDVAYRRFLLDQCSQMAGEVRVLFDPENLPSRLFPRPRALRDLIKMLNDPEVAEAWAPKSDETLGWVYQYFNEQEKADVFQRLYGKKQKIRAQDVPAATQLFTPRWIVRQLVHNTLGRLWVEMHPDSRLKDSLDYLVPLAGETPPQPLKPAREITVLDPACGTMHFGLVAFDLFAEMYREELANAGNPGWPEKPSVTDEGEIPAAILRNNLFGMDIDLRAVQLSALTLYLKAKSVNPKAAITASNLACADVRLPPDDRLDELAEETGLGRPVYERLLRAAWKQLSNTSVAGSLVRVEEEVGALVEEERKRYDREGLQPDLTGGASGFGEEVTAEGFWDGLKDGIFEAFDDYARHQAEEGNDESFFVGEAREGLRVLDVMLRRYDVVVANPPYLSRRNMNKELADFLGGAYPTSKGDLYTAFIERCSEFLDEGGRVGMIAQQSFMFISSYEKMRTGLLEDHAIETVCHVGARAFAEISGEKVNTVMFVLRREGEERQGDGSIGTYFRLTREPNAKAKRLAFERALSQLKSDEEADAVFRYRQGDLRSISGSPWVYWITFGLRRLFETLPNLKAISPPKHGLTTTDNPRFLRFWWELD
ncbi:MAG: BREX-1 system adenine-specific DNA-methyltransferase PglX, partial [Rubrobacteraceae bacterium]|nr:BREX-1 system adenine-specific DNA-methyltransferase PglX [Rubrobacteraceae bacterium]